VAMHVNTWEYLCVCVGVRTCLFACMYTSACVIEFCKKRVMAVFQ
jgi:hypothetical protein